MSKSSLFVALGAALAFLSVALGAFGAHALKAQLSANWLAVYKTGVDYQFYHALALILVGLLIKCFPTIKSVWLSGLMFCLGIVLFSGSLYVMAVTEYRGLGIVTPFGGLAFLLGWANMTWVFIVEKPDRQG